MQPGPSAKLRLKTAQCPVCSQQTLIGPTIDLPADKVDYSPLFLPVAARTAVIEGAERLLDFSLLDNYTCPNDLFVYVGKIRTITVHEGQRVDFNPNFFYKSHVYFRPRREEIIGARLNFFFAALRNAGFNPELAEPPPDTPVSRPRVQNLVDTLLSGGPTGRLEAIDAYKLLRTATSELNWNPLAALLKHFCQSAPVARAVLELQLADLLFLHRRMTERRRDRVTFADLPKTLDLYVHKATSDGSLDDDLAGNILFQCLKLAAISPAEHQERMLRTAFDISGFLVRVRSRLGSEMNRNLDVLAGNADVMLYLNVRLGRQLGTPNPQEETVIRLLRRRLGTIADYIYAQDTKESARTVRLGGFLKNFIETL